MSVQTERDMFPEDLVSPVSTADIEQTADDAGATTFTQRQAVRLAIDKVVAVDPGDIVDWQN